MTAPKLKEAMAEAQRFLRVAQVELDKAPHYSGTFWGSKASGAVRRASMDLTRALAELRKP